MSCVVGMVDRKTDRVWLGSDCAAVSGTRRSLRADDKVFVNGEFAFGFTTSFRMGQLLRYSFTPPDRPDGMGDYEYLCTRWINGIRNCLRHGGFTEILNNREVGGEFLVGYRGELYRVCSDFQVAIPNDDYDAVGCGADYALGAMTIARGRPEQKLKQALEAAELFCTGVSGPFTYVFAQKRATK